MINKLYEKGSNFIKENWKYLVLYAVILLVMLYPLPYYIYTGGGTIDISDRVKITNETDSKGSFNLAYVSELRATLPTYLLSYLIPSWEKAKMEDVTLSLNETMEDVLLRDQIYLADANQNAILVAYRYAGKRVLIHDEKNYVVYIMDGADTNLKIGDILLSVEGKKIEDISTIRHLVEEKNIGDKVVFRILRDGREMDAYFTVIHVDGKKVGGISLLKEYDYTTDPTLTLSFSKSESGPSGGLLLALSIYDKLMDVDLTKDRKIVGTGTIDKDGNVGQIGGVRYKLHGAVKAKADLFLVPSGENYQECVALKEKNHYNIEIVGVSTFEEALRYLMNETN